MVQSYAHSKVAQFTVDFLVFVFVELAIVMHKVDLLRQERVCLLYIFYFIEAEGILWKNHAQMFMVISLGLL